MTLPIILYHYIFHPPDFFDECTEIAEGALEPDVEAGCADPTWNDACEPDGVRNAEGVRISASLRLLAELEDEPPRDGPS